MAHTSFRYVNLSVRDSEQVTERTGHYNCSTRTGGDGARDTGQHHSHAHTHFGYHPTPIPAHNNTSLSPTHTHPLSAPTLPGVVLAPKHDVEVAHKGGGVSSPGRRRNAVHNRATPAGRCTTPHHTCHITHPAHTNTHTAHNHVVCVCEAKTSKQRPSQRTRQEPGMCHANIVGAPESVKGCMQAYRSQSRACATATWGGGEGGTETMEERCTCTNPATHKQTTRAHEMSVGRCDRGKQQPNYNFAPP
jgi:hypothetical protein